MSFELTGPAVYLITKGEATAENFSETSSQILDIVKIAVEEKVPLVQIREKGLSGRAVFDLTQSVLSLSKGSSTRILVNDRADVAAAAGADGVHLASHSMSPAIIRSIFPDLLIGVSIHDHAEMQRAESSADFALFGPVFETPGKGIPCGVEGLKSISASSLPVLGVGGIDASNHDKVLAAGAAGFAAIRSLNEPATLRSIMRSLN